MPRKDPIWKKIPNYPYEISDTGQIKNALGKILKPQTNKSYYRIELYNNEGSRRFLVHRLVATVFLPQPEGKNSVNHIDGNKLNNVVENLEWVTSQENTLHARDVLGVMKIGRQQSQAKLTDFDVITIRELVATSQFTNKEIATRYGVDPSLIATVASGKDWKHIDGPITPQRKRLQESEIQDIRAMISAGNKQKDICAKYGITRETVRRIARGIAWKDVK